MGGRRNLSAEIADLKKKSGASTSKQKPSPAELSKIVAQAVASALDERFSSLQKEPQGLVAKDIKSLDDDVRALFGLVKSLVEREGEVRPLPCIASIATQTSNAELSQNPMDFACANANNRSDVDMTQSDVNLPELPREDRSRRHLVLTVKECMSAIESFHGNADKKAEIVDASELIKFNAWFDAACWKLDAAGMSAPQQVAVICQCLQGPILSAFMLQSKSLEAARTTAELKAQLQMLFAESSVQFAEKALEMRFTAKSLVADIKRFATYIKNSALASDVDRNAFVYLKLREKMTAVRSDILMLAASEYQMHLDPSAPFDEYVAQATQIAHRVQTASPKRAAEAPWQPAPSKKAKGSASASQGKHSKFSSRSTLPEQDMLKAHNRCLKCAWTLEKDGQHSRGHVCDPENFVHRVTGVRKDLKDGLDPNRKVRFAKNA